MPISLKSIDPNPICSGFIWKIKDKSKLAKLVAKVLLGHSRHVIKILNGLSAKPPRNPANATIAHVSSLLNVKDKEDPWHRDGLLFQTISWIAAHRAPSPGRRVISLPHLIPAHKGFDGLQIGIDNSNTLVGAIIFEDKATENARHTITTEVWPEIKGLEQGERQNELMQEATALLERSAIKNVDDAIAAIIWEKLWSYRVSITDDQSHNSHSERLKLFKGYDLIASGGDTGKRRAEVLYLEALRSWMEEFACMVGNAVKLETKRHV